MHMNTYSMQMRHEEKTFKQSYIMWHLFCEAVGQGKPTFKFFKFKSLATLSPPLPPGFIPSPSFNPA